MSSASTVTTAADNSVPETKLLLHLAENGHSFEFQCDALTPIEAIQRSVESLCGVPVHDQLLLCRSMWLDPQQSLGYYKLPRDDHEVFLYNKSRLFTNSAPPPDEAIDIPDAAVPPPPSPSRDPHPLDDATDPALKALGSYERQFRHHFQLANALYGCTQVKFEVCTRLLREHQVQEQALETARSNLDCKYRKIRHRYMEFLRCYTQQHRWHLGLLANLGRDVERLQTTKLHPKLQTETCICLMDFVRGSDTQKWVESCTNSMRQFEAIVSELKLLFEDFKRGMENVLSIKVSGGSKDLELMIKEKQKNVDEQRCIMQSLSKDVNTVKKLVDDCLNCQLPASLRPHDAISALGPMYNIHEKNQLPKVRNCDRDIGKVLDSCKKKKDEMNHLVHDYMKKVARTQYSIKEIYSQLHAYREFMGTQDENFANLKFVHGIYPAYRACLAEIVRRKSSLKFYMGLAGQLAERLAAERVSEVKIREGFFKAWSKYIPHDILTSMGLFDSPSQCDVNIAPFDTNLLEIDITDVDQFAPQYPVGLLSKYEHNGASKSCSTTSSDSCHLAKSGENSEDIYEKYTSKELLDGYESVNIAGTSKFEVENACLKAELASAITLICSLSTEIGYDSLDDSKLDSMLKTIAEKMSEALHFKDEYIKHLKSELNVKRVQCLSYEKHIQELEQGLSVQYLQGRMLSAKDASESAPSELKTCGYKYEISGNGDAHMPSLCTEPMDEVSCISTSLDPKFDPITGQPGRPREVEDDNMSDLSGTLNMQVVDSSRNSMDASMLETTQDEEQVDLDEHQVDNIDKNQVSNIHREQKMLTATKCSSDEPPNKLPCETAVELSSESKAKDGLILDLQTALANKSNQCNETESKLKAAMEEVSSLKRELEISRHRLDEAQMNCAHLENCLHEAREEAHTHLCAADRRASEYSALRTTAVKLRSLFERFRSCVTASVGVASFVESLRSLALSLASSSNENEDDGVAEFRECITVLAKKVSLLSRHRAELLDRCSRGEAAHGHLVKELEAKTELIRSLYSKHQLEKQASKEKISFGRFELHELAAFVLNSCGHYEAINRSCSNYFLSAESVALFTQHLNIPTHIIGQIVHIERQVATPPAPVRAGLGDQMGTLSPAGLGVASNPYSLPVGSEYFIVTVAMVPDTIYSSCG